MEKYTGIPCPVCGRNFTDDDDIVVCPDCGAPHHRACYRERGRCAFEEQHAEGTAWKNPKNQPPVEFPDAAPAAREGAAPVVCPRCRAANAPGSVFCTACGQRLAGQGPNASDQGPPPSYQQNYRPGYPPGLGAQQQARVQAFGIGLDDEIDGVPVKEIAQFVGENTFYYLPRFKIFSSGVRALSINFSAVVFNFFYYFNRKMYRAGALFLGLFLLNLLPNLLLVYYNFPGMMQSFLTGSLFDYTFAGYEKLVMAANPLHYVYLIACVAGGFFANKLYYRFVMDRVRALKAEYTGRPESEYSQALAIHGRTNKVLVVAVIATLFVGYIVYYGILLASYTFK